MVPIFIQTDRRVIDVAKIQHIDLHPPRVKLITLHFVGGEILHITREEAEQLLDTIGELHRRDMLHAVRAGATWTIGGRR